MIDNEFIIEFLRTVEEHDLYYDIYWSTEGDDAPITFYVNCNDTFFWGCSDSEPVTTDTLAIFKQSLEDCLNNGDVFRTYAPALYAARVRKMRPQGAAYPNKHPGLWLLFDEAGPERQVDIANPYRPGEYKSQ